MWDRLYVFLRKESLPSVTKTSIMIDVNKQGKSQFFRFQGSIAALDKLKFKMRCERSNI